MDARWGKYQILKETKQIYVYLEWFFWAGD